MQKLFISFFLVSLLINDSFSQVNVQTGSASYSIPIFNFSDGKSGLSHNVILAYSSGSGLKVNEFPSNMGQGWDLICGGSIIRKQNGEPDDQNSTTTFPIVGYNNTRVFNQNLAAYTDNYQSFVWTGDCYSRDYVDHYYPNGFTRGHYYRGVQ